MKKIWITGLIGLVTTWCGITADAASSYMRGIQRSENRIEDATGAAFRHMGIAIEDPEVIVLVRGRLLVDIVQEVKSRFPGINTIRVPMHPHGAEGCAGFAANPDAYITNYVLPLVEAARTADLRLILCYHAISDWDATMVETQIKPFWAKIISALDPDEDTHVCAELFNEALTPADYWTSWRENFAQPLVTWFNQEAPQLFPLIGSPRWNQYYPVEAATAPVTGNFAYVIHTYPGHGTTVDDWEAAFGHIADVAPVVCTEFGFERVSPSGQAHLIGGIEYFNGLTEWLDSRGLGSVAWLYSSTWEPRMLLSDGEGLTEFGEAARLYYERKAMIGVDPVLHEGGWNITKPGSAGHSSVEVLRLNLRAVSEIIMEFAGSSSAINNLLMPGYIRARFVPDRAEEEVGQSVLPYGPASDHNGPTTNGVIRIGVYPPQNGSLIVEVGHSNWRTHVHECRIYAATFEMRGLRQTEDNQFEISFRSAAEGLYRVEKTLNDLSAFVPVQSRIAGTPPVNTVLVDAGAGASAFRVVIDE